MHIHNNLVCGTPIDLRIFNLGILYQPTVYEYSQLGFDVSEIMSMLVTLIELEKRVKEMEDNEDKPRNKFDLIPLAEIISKSAIEEQRKEEINKSWGKADLVRKKKYYSFLEKLLIIIMLVYQCDEDEISIVSENKMLILIRDKALINEENFEIFFNTLLKMFHINPKDLNFKEEKWTELSHSEREKELIEKFKRKEAERRRKGVKLLGDFVNVVCLKENRSFAEINSMTIYQLLTLYYASSIKEVSDMQKRLVTSGGFVDVSKIEIEDWEKKIKLDIDDTIL